MDSPGLLQALLYGLAPGGDPESFIVSPRRRLSVSSAVVAIPATGSNSVLATLPLQDVLNVDDGLYLEYLAGQIIPQDTSGHLQIVDLALTLESGIGLTFFNLGGPTATTLFPRLGTALQFPAPPLFAFRDLDAFARLSGVPNLLGDQPMHLRLTVSLSNNDAAPHSAVLNFQAIYRRVQGLLGA